MSDYKDLNLNRDELEQHVMAFVGRGGFTLDDEISNTNTGKRVKFGASRLRVCHGRFIFKQERHDNRPLETW